MKRKKNVLKRHINANFALLILLALSLGWLCRNNSAVKCEGVIKAKNEIFTGRAKTNEQAGLNACNKFCVATDSKYDAMYRVWLSSNDGKRLAEIKKRQPTKEEAVLANERLLNYITINCASICYKNANKGKHTLEINCKK